MSAVNPTTWNFPTSVRFSPGAVTLLPEICKELGIGQPLVITDRGLLDMTFVAEIVARNNEAGLPTGLYGEVQGNPVADNVEGAVAAFRNSSHDGIIAIGGGSALDVAKTVALIARQDFGLWDLGGPHYDWTAIDPADIAPVIAVPTTAGTGSEVGRSAVISHEQSQTKRVIFHPKLMPPMVVLDPELTCGLPPTITAATGIDAFVHCFEAYCAPGYHPMAEGIAMEGMRLVAKALPRAYDDGDDIEARGWMLTAATMGATAFQKDLGAVHALAHPIGAVYNTHHGLTNAVLLPYVMMANRAAISERMELLGRVLDLTGAGFDSVQQWVLTFRERLGIPHTLKEVGVPDNAIEDIAGRAFRDPCAQGNPVPLTIEEYAQVFSNALCGSLE